MIKIFTKNKNDKIELSVKELKELLDEAYWDGWRANTGVTYTYTTPCINGPYVWTSASSGDILTLKDNPQWSTTTTSASTEAKINNVSGD